MTANEMRVAVVTQYKKLLGRNKYDRGLRDYCFKKHPDGNYYSDCSSSISYSYKEAGCGFGILNTVGMYQSRKLTNVDVIIKNGQIQNPEVLRVGDLLLFAGSDPDRIYADCVGHVEMVYIVAGSVVTICGHGSGTPSLKDLRSYCKSRYNSKAYTSVGNKGLLCVRRYIQDDGTLGNNTLIIPNAMKAVGRIKITSNTAFLRFGAGAIYSFHKAVKKGDEFDIPDTTGWTCIDYKNACRWISSRYIDMSGRCNSKLVNIRSGASTSCKSVGVAHLGDQLKIVNTSRWCPVIRDNSIYWIGEKQIEYGVL